MTLENSNAQNIPSILYKYRSWENEKHKTIITKHQLYLASPTEFEDWKDCLMSNERFEFTQIQIMNEYLKISKKIHPEHPIDTHIEIAIKLANECDIDQLSSDIIENYKSQNSNIGVLSLAKRPDIKLMWGKYSNLGKGLCIGFKTEYIVPFMTRMSHINYCDILPKIDVNESLDEQIWKHIFCKEKNWEFEKEYRTYRYEKLGFNAASRLLSVPKEAFAEVIFGYLMTPEHKLEIKNICKNTGLTPIFLESELSNNTIKLYQAF